MSCECGHEMKEHAHEHKGEEAGCCGGSCGCGHSHEPMNEKEKIVALKNYHKALLEEAKMIEQEVKTLEKGSKKKK